jgi:hypothetical protein
MLVACLFVLQLLACGGGGCAWVQEQNKAKKESGVWMQGRSIGRDKPQCRCFVLHRSAFFS